MNPARLISCPNNQTAMSEIKEQSKRGGKRPGAGRKPGAKDRITRTGAQERALAVHQAVVARVQPSGALLDPVEGIMEVAEWALNQWRVLSMAQDQGAAEMAECAVEWCAKAAPYIRPRLAAVAVASEENAVELIREVRRVIVDPRNA